MVFIFSILHDFFRAHIKSSKSSLRPKSTTFWSLVGCEQSFQSALCWWMGARSKNNIWFWLKKERKTRHVDEMKNIPGVREGHRGTVPLRRNGRIAPQEWCNKTPRGFRARMIGTYVRSKELSNSLGKSTLRWASLVYQLIQKRTRLT
jgi:hypothetical protein